MVYEGPPAQLGAATDSATARALVARAHPRRASAVDYSEGSAIVIRGPRTWNLKGDDVSIPQDRLTVLTGVSGSGKSTLLETVLYRGILRQRGEMTDAPGPHDGIDPAGPKKLHAVRREATKLSAEPRPFSV